MFCEVEEHQVASHCRQHRIVFVPSISLQREERCKESPRRVFNMGSLSGNVQQSVVRFIPSETPFFIMNIEEQIKRKLLNSGTQVHWKKLQTIRNAQCVQHRTTFPAVASNNCFVDRLLVGTQSCLCLLLLSRAPKTVFRFIKIVIFKTTILSCFRAFIGTKTLQVNKNYESYSCQIPLRRFWRWLFVSTSNPARFLRKKKSLGITH